MNNELKTLINQGKISSETIEILVGIDADKLNCYLNGNINILDLNETAYLYNLLCMLGLGIEIECGDKRISAIIDTIVKFYKFSHKQISLCTGIDETIIIDMHKSPKNIDYKKRYEVAIKIFMLYYVFKYPDYQKIKQQL